MSDSVWTKAVVEATKDIIQKQTQTATNYAIREATRGAVSELIASILSDLAANVCGKVAAELVSSVAQRMLHIEDRLKRIDRQTKVLLDEAIRTAQSEYDLLASIEVNSQAPPQWLMLRGSATIDALARALSIQELCQAEQSVLFRTRMLQGLCARRFLGSPELAKEYLRPVLESLRQSIEAANKDFVSAKDRCSELSSDVIRLTSIARDPKHPPEYQRIEIEKMIRGVECGTGRFREVPINDSARAIAAISAAEREQEGWQKVQEDLAVELASLKGLERILVSLTVPHSAPV